MSSQFVRTSLAGGACLALLRVGSALAAPQDLDQHASADPNATVEIIDVAGSINVIGWDKPEVEASGRFTNSMQRLDLAGSGNHITVRVAIPEETSKGSDATGLLTVHIPTHGSIEISSVTADLNVNGVTGPVRARTVSGNVKAAGVNAARVNTVSGDVSLKVDGGDAEVQTMSGDIDISGASGTVSINSVSGGGKLTLGTVHSLRLSTVSGDFTINSQLDSNAQFEAQSISGDLKLNFSGAPPARYNLQSLSGDITNCTAPEASQASYGPGSNLVFTSGNGSVQVHVSSKTGDLSLCSK